LLNRFQKRLEATYYFSGLEKDTQYSGL